MSPSPPSIALSTWASTGIDTAAIYGLGHSEEVVGRALKSSSISLPFFTKCSMRLAQGPLHLPVLKAGSWPRSWRVR